MKTLRMALLLLLISIPFRPARAGDVPADATEINPVLVGVEMPDLSLRRADGTEVSLRQLIAGKPTVLVYYRGGWCPFCTRHLAALGRQQDELRQLGFQIIAVSADKPTKIRELDKERESDYLLLSDNTMAGARRLGIAFKVDDETVRRYKQKHGIDLERDSGLDHHQLPVPAVFVLDRKGTITFHYINPNYRVRLDGTVLTAAARAALAR